MDGLYGSSRDYMDRQVGRGSVEYWMVWIEAAETILTGRQVSRQGKR